MNVTKMEDCQLIQELQGDKILGKIVNRESAITTNFGGILNLDSGIIKNLMSNLL